MTLLLACTAGPGEPYAQIEGVEVFGPAVVSPSAELGSLYFALRVTSGTGDTLVGVGIGDLGLASIHTMNEVEGISRMEPVDAVPLAEGTSVFFRPGSLHVMLEDVQQQLSVGDSVTVNLELSGRGVIELTVPIMTYSEMIQRIERLEGSGL